MTKSRRRCLLPLLVAFVAIALLLIPAPDVLACPNCKAAVPEFPQPGATDAAATPDIATGYFWSILFMISVPFTLVATMGGTLYFALRRSAPMIQPDTR
jgi:hypothetical protein